MLHGFAGRVAKCGQIGNTIPVHIIALMRVRTNLSGYRAMTTRWKVYLVPGEEELGVVWKDKGGVYWDSPTRRQKFPTGTTLFVDVRQHIANAYGAYANQLEFRKAS